MRFRPKFHWLQLAAAVIWIGLSCGWLRKSNAPPGIHLAYLIAGTLWACVAIACVAHHFLTWLEVSDSGLIQRRVWSTRTVLWNEVTHVCPWQPLTKPTGGWLKVDYVRPAPMSERGELLFQCAERDALVRAIRSHAPQADFEFFHAEL